VRISATCSPAQLQRPTAKLFQSLTENIGNPRLLEHLAAVTTLMKVSSTWDQFMEMLDKGLPRQVALPLFDQIDNAEN
jgi:hypothetical protein